MFAGRGRAIAGRILAGTLLASTMYVVLRVFFLSEMEYLYASLGLPLLLCLGYACVRLVPSAYRSTRIAYILGGAAVGALILGLIGWRSDLELVGALTGALLGGLIARGLAAGVIESVVAGAVLYSALSALIAPYPHSGAFGGSLAIPGGLVGASLIWLCPTERRSGTVSLVLAGAALFVALGALLDHPIGLGGSMATAACLLGASITGIFCEPRQRQLASPRASGLQVSSVGEMQTDDRPCAAHESTGPVEQLARRRSRGSVRRILIAVFCCAFLLSGFRKDVKIAMNGMTRLVLFLGAPAAGVILQRRSGGSGIAGGAIAGTATFFLSTLSLYAWLYWNPQIGALPEPLKQIVHSAVAGGTFGVIIGALVWGLMLMDRPSQRGRDNLPLVQRSPRATGDDLATQEPRLLLGALAAATVYEVEADLAGNVSENGYALILAAWILLLVAFCFDLLRILSRALRLVFGQRRTG